MTFEFDAHGHDCHPRVHAEETQAQRGQQTGPRSHSLWMQVCLPGPHSWLGPPFQPSSQALDPHFSSTLLSPLQDSDASRSSAPPSRPVKLLCSLCTRSFPVLALTQAQGLLARRPGEPGKAAQHKRFYLQRQLWAPPEGSKTALAWGLSLGHTAFPVLGAGPSQPVGNLGKGPGDRPSPHLLQSIWLRLGAEK